MKTERKSLANIQGKLSRTEMKKIMAGVMKKDCPGCYRSNVLYSCSENEYGNCVNSYCGSTNCSGL